MRKVFLIAMREYLAAVRTKSFIVSLVLIPLMMAGSVGIQLLIHKFDDDKEKKFAVLDRTPGQQLYGVLKAAESAHNQEKTIKTPFGEQKESPYLLEAAEPSDNLELQRFHLSDRVRRGDLAGFLEIDPEAVASPPNKKSGSSAPPREKAPLRYYSKTSMPDSFSRWAHAVVNDAIMKKRSREKGVEDEAIAYILSQVDLKTRPLTKWDAASGTIEESSEASQIGAILVPPALVALMFVMIMVGATPLMQGVLEEKMQRIAEVLLGSVSPFRLMCGKLIGMVGVSLTVVAVYLGGAYWAAHRYGFTEYVPIYVLMWFLFFQTLAVVMYGSLFIAIGAACTDAKETQTLLLPVALIASIPLFLLANVIRDPNSTFVQIVSLFPPATPMLMTARVAMPSGVPWWQLILGGFSVVATTWVCIYAAGRIFRVGLLMQGKGANFGQLFKWVFRG